MVGLFQSALVHVGLWKTPGRAGQGQTPSHFQNLPRAGSPQGAQPSECIRWPLPPARSAVSSHQQHAHSPRGGGRGGGRGTALQQCPAAFVFGRGARESWVSALLLLLPLSGLGQVTPCHLLWDGWPVERGHQTTPSITSGSNVPRPAAWSCLPDLLLSLISGSPPNPVLSPSLSGRSQRPP